MNKKAFLSFLLIMVCCSAFFACKKSKNGTTADVTRNYFPVKLGHWVEYDVDSLYYIDTLSRPLERKSQQMYTISDSFRDDQNRLSFIVNIMSRPFDGAVWNANSVALLTSTATGIEWVQSNNRYIKLMFPVLDNFTWKGNAYIQSQNPLFYYLGNWDYTYQNVGAIYNNGFENFNNTATVIQADQSQNAPLADAGLAAYRTYSKEVYGYGVGLVYKELTHWTYNPVDSVISYQQGYTVILRAIDHN